MYVLDTDILTLAHFGHSGIADRITRAGQDNISTTIITEIEILRGRHEFLLKASDAEQLLRAQSLLQRSKELLADITVLHLDDESVTEFQKLRRLKKLKKIGRADLLIASIALARDATIVTRNLRDFSRISGLKAENWAD